MPSLEMARLDTSPSCPASRAAPFPPSGHASPFQALAIARRSVEGCPLIQKAGPTRSLFRREGVPAARARTPL
jgi:hypothetical protein